MDSSKEFKAEVSFTIKEEDEVASDPGLAFAPIAFDPDAQVAALAIKEAAPVLEEDEAEDVKPDIKPAIEAIHIAAVHHAVKKEEPEKESDEDEPAPPATPKRLKPKKST